MSTVQLLPGINQQKVKTNRLDMAYLLSGAGNIPIVLIDGTCSLGFMASSNPALNLTYCMNFSRPEKRRQKSANIENIYTGLLKSAYKEAFNILDKISVFLNQYYNLGLKESSIYFDTIWVKDKKKNPSIREEILSSENMSLYALYSHSAEGLMKKGNLGKVRKICLLSLVSKE